MSRGAIRIVHLGIGAFFRAFGLPWIEEAARRDGSDWGVLGVSLRSGAVRDRLAARDFRYHALERGPGGTTARDIGLLRGVLVAPEDPGAAIAAMADPQVSILSLTVTEKGYCHTPATGEPDLADPGILHDLATPDAPRTAPGMIVAALAARRAAGSAGPTCLSCDNLPGNGSVLRNVVLGLAARRDPSLADWIAHNVTFPATMVDRIVPATTGADIDEVARLTGIRDDGTVVHEPFRQWVIEDAFAGPRPPLEAAGVQIVPDVAPFERIKLRCLNGTHSAIAYLGVLAGKATVSAAVADPAFAGFVEALWREEIVPGLAAPPGADPAAYCAALMARYRNPAIAHRTAQIAADGSQKLPQRILATVSGNLAAGRPVARLALVVAAWIRFLRGVGDDGTPREVSDPLAETLIHDALSPDPVASVLGVPAVFGPLGRDARFRAEVQRAYDALAAQGAQAVLAAMR